MPARDPERFDSAPSWLWDPARQRADRASPEARTLFPNSFELSEGALSPTDPVAALSNACHAALISTGRAEYGPAEIGDRRFCCRIQTQTLDRGGLGVQIEIASRESVGEGGRDELSGDGPLARAAHDLRTPLTAIIGFAEFISASGLAMPEQTRQGYLADIVQAGRFASRMALDLLDYAGASTAGLKSRGRADLAEIAQSSARLLAMEAEQRDIAIKVSVYADGSDVAADPDQIRRAFGNLLGNAVAHARSAVEVSLAPHGERGLALCVVDDGPGLSSDELRIAMQPFGRPRRAESDTGDKGVGLGLPIAKRFAEINGARLEIESPPGAGLTARLVFPAARRIVRDNESD